jgi:hypothetical protein
MFFAKLVIEIAEQLQIYTYMSYGDVFISFLISQLFRYVNQAGGIELSNFTIYFES